MVTRAAVAAVSTGDTASRWRYRLGRQGERCNEDAMSVIEAAIRGGAVTVLLLVATLLLRDRRRVPTGLYSALFALSVAAYVIASAPGFFALDPQWRIPITLASMGTPAVFWLAAVAYFDDDFKPSLYRYLAWLSLVLLGLWQMVGQQPIAYVLHHGLSLLFIGIAAWQAV